MRAPSWLSLLGIAGIALPPASPSQTEWTRLPLTLRGSTWAHAMTYDFRRDVIWRHGGSDPTAVSGTWAWSPAGWARVPQPGGPLPRMWSAMTYDIGRDRTVLFGGSYYNQLLVGTWEWDGNRWQFLDLPGPSPRLGHQMVYDVARGYLLLFGGADASGTYGDTWTWDGTMWVRVFPQSSPGPRLHHVMVYDIARSEIVLFGGRDGGTFLDDTWVWNGTTWLQRQPSRSPIGREAAAFAYDIPRRRCVLHGGRNPRPPLPRETWEWDGSDWSLRATGNTPEAQSGAAAAFHADLGQTILWGGWGVTGGTPWGTWAYAPTVPAEVSRNGAGCAGWNPVELEADLPWLGATQTFNLCTATANTGPALVWLGFSDTVWRGQPLPVSLGAVGMSGCVARVSPEGVFFGVLRSGCAAWSFSLPSNSVLLGSRYFSQALAAAPGANAAGLLPSNALALTLGGL